MQQIEHKLHEWQIAILGRLVSQPTLRFNQLLLDGLTSEHMNYHLQKLVEAGLVVKANDGYGLTDKGKDFTNLMDDGVELIEKQPKTSVIIRGVRANAQGQIEHLVTRRLRQPYLGKVGRIGGKVRFGETLEQAAARELFEETGLTTKVMKLQEVYHKVRHREDGTFVQDVIFYIFFCKDFAGDFIVKTPHQENMWLTKAEVFGGDYDVFDDLELFDELEPQPLNFTESVGIAIGY